MLYLLLCTAAVLVALVVAWAARRHLAAVAWDRELETAFHSTERQEMPTRPVL